MYCTNVAFPISAPRKLLKINVLNRPFHVRYRIILDEPR